MQNRLQAKSVKNLKLARRNRPVYWTALCLLVLGTLGCAGTRIKQCDGKTFVAKLDPNLINSAVWYTYIGKTPDRAYLEQDHPAFLGPGVSVTIYWTRLSDLPDEFLDGLRRKSESSPVPKP